VTAAIRRTFRAAILAAVIVATIPLWLPAAADAPILSLIFNR